MLAEKHHVAVIPVGDDQQASCCCGWYGDRYAGPGPAQVQANRHLADLNSQPAKAGEPA